MWSNSQLKNLRQHVDHLGLTMTWYSEKNLRSTICITWFHVLSNQKSWKVSIPEAKKFSSNFSQRIGGIDGIFFWNLLREKKMKLGRFFCLLGEKSIGEFFFSLPDKQPVPLFGTLSAYVLNYIPSRGLCILVWIKIIIIMSFRYVSMKLKV